MSEYKITGREILFSTIIVCVMVGLGVWISNPILRVATENAMKITSLVKVNDDEKFAYIARTNVGDFLAEGEIVAIDSVSIPDINGYYLQIDKVKERYTIHTRTVTTTDSKGHTHIRTEIYWSWDRIGKEVFCSDSVRFLGQEFLVDSIAHWINTSYKETIKESGSIRYKYYTYPTKTKGVMHGVCDDKTYKKLKFDEGDTIESVVKSAEERISGSPVLFWIIWMIITAGIIFLFYYAENNWLED